MRGISGQECPRALLRWKPGGAAGFEEVEGAVDVGGDEVAGAGDAAIDVGLCGEVHDVGDVMLADDAEDFVLVPQIDFFENVARMDVMNAGEVFEMAGIGEAVEIDEPGDLRPVDDVANEIGADESGAACDQKVHVRRLRRLAQIFLRGDGLGSRVLIGVICGSDRGD